jgi:asparagine synthase (glutamine-hydrolysing)
MCGIAGFFSKEKESIKDLEEMTESLKHRGPDERGFFFEEGIGLGHRRLSIIDLTTGSQPIFNEDKSVVVCFNGEIYNYKELRDDLLKDGHIFKTNSDTEVLVHLYEKYGEFFPEKLNGIFAFALYDKRDRKLLLVRDPVGVKPLYYAILKDKILFGSELKSILNYKNFSPDLDLKSVALYFQMEYFPAPLTPFKETKKLLPSHILVAKSPDDYKVIKYNAFNFSEERLSESELCEKIRETVFQSVKRQLISDVPLGVFLSGGVDSTIVTLAMKNCGGNVKSFSIGFEEKDFDESKFSRIASSHLKTDHSEMIFTEKDILKEIEFVLSKIDEPLADPSLFPTSLLSRFAREKVKVALGGDGGDELFCGYPTYLIHKYFNLYKLTPKFIRKNSLLLADKILPAGEGNLTFPYKMRKFIDGAEFEMPERHFAFMGAFNRIKLKKLIPDVELEFSPLNWIEEPPFKDRVTTAEWLDFRTYLMEDVLQKVDRMSMLSSLEVRVPLLDREMVNLAFSIPSSMKIKGLNLKYLLKKSFKRDLPKNFFERKKRGFAVPISRWIKGELREFVKDVLDRENLKDFPFLNYKEVESILKKHYEGKQDNRKLIWSLVTFCNSVKGTKCPN